MMLPALLHRSRLFSHTALAAGLFFSAFSARAAEEADPRTDNSPWGIASGAEWAKDFPKFNPLLHEAGVTWMRYFSEWQTVQPAEGQWNWAPMDAFLASSKENNIRVAGLFAFAARWATTDGSTRRVPLKDNRFWRDYVTAVVGRYQSDVKYWEVWNEFNGSFATGEKTPKVYADLVREASTAAKQADPGARIGMSIANFDIGFFDKAIKAGAAGHFDFLAVHPYENLVAAMDGGEMGYLSLAGSLRKVLRENKQPEDMPLWITEIGVQSAIQPDVVKDAAQADALVMCYILSIVQGFDKVFWFEARGPAYGKGTDHGIIRADWSLRPVYQAFKTMTSLLGPEPRYEGWLNVGGNGFGFVFAGAEGAVLVAWAKKGAESKAVFQGDVTMRDVTGGSVPLAAGQAVALTRSPVYFTGVPAGLVDQARANKAQDFPWGVDYSSADLARIALGATNREEGIMQNKLETSAVVQGLDWTARQSTNLKGGEGHYLYFRVDPTFAGFGKNKLEITVVARRADSGKPTGMNVTYESLSGYKSIKDGRWEIPEGEEWVEKTWMLEDSNFVGAWGWNFRTDAGGSKGEFQVREIRIKKPVSATR